MATPVWRPTSINRKSHTDQDEFTLSDPENTEYLKDITPNNGKDTCIHRKFTPSSFQWWSVIINPKPTKQTKETNYGIATGRNTM